MKEKTDREAGYEIDLDRKDVNATGDCPILYALDIVGQKWKLPAIWYLHEKEATRWAELKRRMPGITDAMLTKTLRELESAGLVLRTDHGEVPPRVDYSLTVRGRELIPAMAGIYAWGEEQMRLDAEKHGARHI